MSPAKTAWSLVGMALFVVGFWVGLCYLVAGVS